MGIPERFRVNYGTDRAVYIFGGHHKFRCVQLNIPMCDGPAARPHADGESETSAAAVLAIKMFEYVADQPDTLSACLERLERLPQRTSRVAVPREISGAVKAPHSGQKEIKINESSRPDIHPLSKISGWVERRRHALMLCLDRDPLQVSAVPNDHRAIAGGKLLPSVAIDLCPHRLIISTLTLAPRCELSATRSMTVVCADGQVNRIGLGSMDVRPVAALWCCTASSLRRTSLAVTNCLEDLMPLTWRPRMGETRGEQTNEPP
jgi:hypothetical protein